MPIIDFRCTTDETCGVAFEQYRSVHSTEVPPCPKCGGPSERFWVPAGCSTTFADPVVVFKAPDGSFRFVGDRDGQSAAAYAKQGLERVELRGWADVRRFENVVNRQEYAKICHRIERQQAAMEEGERIRRSDFHHGVRQGFMIPEREVGPDGQIRPTGRMKMVHLSQRTKDIADHVVARNNQRRERPRDPGFYVEVFSMDRSNREASRDRDGRRRRD